MRKIFIINIILILASCSLQTGSPKISDLTLTKNNSGIGFEVKIDGFWELSEEEINGLPPLLLSALKDELSSSTPNNWSKSETNKIIKHFSEYHIQYVGIIVNGSHMIYCNAIPENKYFDTTSPIIVMDGGFWYWEAIIDPASGKFLDFGSNGYA